MSRKPQGFLLPDVIHPEEYVCFKVRVPKNLTYITNFKGHLFELTKWYTHQRDDAHTGREVAEVWREVYFNLEMYDCEEDMACCEETNNLLGNIYALLKSGATINFNVGASPLEGLPECAPDDFSGSDGDIPTDAEFRLRALCYAIRNAFADALVNQFQLLFMKQSSIERFRTAVNAVKTNQTQFWLHDTVIYLKSADLEEIIDHPEYFDSFVCTAYANWLGLDLTFENFKEGLDGYIFVDPPVNATDRMYFVIWNWLSYSKNFTMFGEALDFSFEAVQQNEDIGNDCVCSDPLFCGIVSEERILSGIHYPPNPVIRTGDRTFRIFSVTAPDGFADLHNIHFKWDGSNCFEIESWIFVWETERHTLNTGSSFSVTCDDVLGPPPTVDVCYREVFISHGSPLGGSDPNGAKHYVDVTIKDPCPCE